MRKLNPALVVGLLAAVGLWVFSRSRHGEAIIADVVDYGAGVMTSDLSPSAALVNMLKLSETRGGVPNLIPYRLGDGGATIGYGRFYPDNGPPPPAHITHAQAEAWFAEDVESRAARWVRQFISVPLTQFQFDALVHMAYNLSPASFQNIADAVNSGEDPEQAALRYVRPGTNLERGLRIRRGHEIALFRDGVYYG